MENSEYLKKAKRLIREVKEKSLTSEERREMAVELAALMLNEARRQQTTHEHRHQLQLARMMDDPDGKAFTTALTDECFRSSNSKRVADQLVFLINKFGIPKYLSYIKQIQVLILKLFGSNMPYLFVPLIRHALRKESSKVIIPGERRRLAKHMEKRRREGVRINLNQLGEAILGEEEAAAKMQLYLEDLSRPEVEYISVKVSTLCSQLKLLAWEETLHILETRLKSLFRRAMKHTFVRPNGKCVPKFVNLDMEEYRDLHLTVELFKKVLEEPEFYQFSSGIVLQSYLPDSFLIQRELTGWAMKRVANGGAPIKIRIVKGANLAMEKVEASLHGWPQPPYQTKIEVDANYKRMMTYACTLEHAKAAHIGIGSHNLFDIAYAMLLRSEMGACEFVEFEMLEGMADHIRRIVQELSGDMLLYCPAAKNEEFAHAMAYLIRRLDENTAQENFLRHAFNLIPGTHEWQQQAIQFSLACHAMNNIGSNPRKIQNRFLAPEKSDIHSPFVNEPETDWSLPPNRKWIQNLIAESVNKNFENIPVVINGKEIHSEINYRIGRDPSCPLTELYRCTLADMPQIDLALKTAEKAQKKWKNASVQERSKALHELAHILKLKRGELIAAMVADGGKIVSEADAEVSEAIDFAEYYRRNLEDLAKMEDVDWQPKGTVLVAPPWNFPCSIPLGGIAGALAAGNSVLFKPALEAAYVGWKLAECCWEAGIGKDVLQFILCEDDPAGSQLVQDPRVSCILLTGGAETAKLMLKLRQGIDLFAETGGKNCMIITAMADRELAIKDLIQSAFGHSGQKCSACSLAICEEEIYNDPSFRKTLKDAAASLKTGSAWHLSTTVNPLIRHPDETLARGLTKLEEGEEWLLEPKQDSGNPNLWSPGIKLGVQKGSFTHRTELFGPVLGIMKAKNLEEAIQLANDTPYGLTSGLHSLDEREKQMWTGRIEAGNCYINRSITGAIVQRQPFGGCKQSSFGPGAKAGGPNYLMQLMRPEQKSPPRDQEPVKAELHLLSAYLEKLGVNAHNTEIWKASIGSYAYHWNNYFSKAHDPSLILGQDNFLKYTPHKKILYRINKLDDFLDQMRIIAAAMTCGTPIAVSGNSEKVQLLKGEWLKIAKDVNIIEETEEEFINGIQETPFQRIRFVSGPSLKLRQALGESASNVMIAPPIANGRIELVHYLREVSISIDYHRYGNLGLREHEKRSQIL